MLTQNWLEIFIGYAQQKEIGAIGARLYYDDKTIQHAGIVVGLGGIAGNRFKSIPKSGHGYFARESMIENLSAVTGACLMTKTKIYVFKLLTKSSLCSKMTMYLNKSCLTLQHQP